MNWLEQRQQEQAATQRAAMDCLQRADRRSLLVEIKVSCVQLTSKKNNLKTGQEMDSNSQVTQGGDAIASEMCPDPGIPENGKRAGSDFRSLRTRQQLPRFRQSARCQVMISCPATTGQQLNVFSKIMKCEKLFSK